MHSSRNLSNKDGKSEYLADVFGMTYYSTLTKERRKEGRKERMDGGRDRRKETPKSNQPFYSTH